MPLQRRLPKRGFRAYRRIDYQVVNVKDLGRVEGSEANQETLRAAGLVSSKRRPVKILGEGEISRALKVSAQAFSQSARQKIEAAGGEVIEV